MSLSSDTIIQYKREMHALFQTMAGRKMLLLSALSSVVLSSARWLLALAMSRYRSELAIRSVARQPPRPSPRLQDDTCQTGQRAWRWCPSPTLQPVSPAPPHSWFRISRRLSPRAATHLVLAKLSCFTPRISCLIPSISSSSSKSSSISRPS